MDFSFYTFNYLYCVILTVIDIFILYRFILKVIVLIIMTKCCAYITLFLFTAYFDNMTIFIVVKTLSNSAFFMK